MRPESKRDNNTQFTAKWRHFHPQATLFVRNPFDHDIIFRVADENDQPFEYRCPAGQVCELPGGAVATLGLKAIVDEMFNDRGKDLIRIWDPRVRAEYEAEIIVRVREAPTSVATSTPGGPIDLTASEDDLSVSDQDRVAATALNKPQRQQDEEQAFSAARRSSKRTPQPAVAAKGGGRMAADNELAATAAASLGSRDQVIEED